MAISPYYVTSKELECRTVRTSGTITQCRCVGYDGAHTTTAGARPWGIAKMNAESGKDTTLVTEGSAVVESGGAIALGDALTTDTAGRLVEATTGQYVFGRALGTATAAGQFLEVHITREGTI